MELNVMQYIQFPNYPYLLFKIGERNFKLTEKFRALLVLDSAVLLRINQRAKLRGTKHGN